MRLKAWITISENKLIKFFIFYFIILCVSACSPHKRLPQGTETLLLKKEALVNSLFFSGTIQPLKTVVIPSPADGVVLEMPLQYGDTVKSGQLLMVLSSTKFISDYKTALMQYIKSKNEFNTAQTQLNESEFLHKNQLISDDDFKMKQSNFYGAQLGLVQAKDTLESLIHQFGIKEASLYQLSIADVDKISKAMHLEMNSENLRIVSPINGYFLSSLKNEDENKKIAKGDLVKQGDVLAVIGDMSGLSVRIKVNELTINQIKVGQPVKVTGLAFPDEILNGKIKRVDKQGESVAGGLPMFAVEIAIPKLTSEQQRTIHAGMSAKVEINTGEAGQLMVPIKAVQELNGKTVVNVVDGDGRTHAVIVKTGKTTSNAVSILSGLKEGDSIVIAH